MSKGPQTARKNSLLDGKAIEIDWTWVYYGGSLWILVSVGNSLMITFVDNGF